VKRVFLALAVLGAALSCGTNTEVEPQLTITQGLYGQLTKRCTPAGCVGAPLEGAPVGWFDRSPFPGDGGVRPTPVKELVSGKNGFYELALDSNTRGYVAIGQANAAEGVIWLTATATTVPRGLGRIDWYGGPGNDGTWTDVR